MNSVVNLEVVQGTIRFEFTDVERIDGFVSLEKIYLKDNGLSYFGFAKKFTRVDFLYLMKLLKQGLIRFENQQLL